MLSPKCTATSEKGWRTTLHTEARQMRGGLWWGDEWGQTRVAPGSHARAATSSCALRRKQTPPRYALGGTQGWTECPVVVEPHAVTSIVPCSPRCHLSTGSGLKTGPGHQHFIARLMERSDIHWQRNYLNKQPNLFCIISPTSFFVSFSSLYYFPLAGGYNLSAISKPSSIIHLSAPGWALAQWLCRPSRFKGLLESALEFGIFQGL